MSTVVQPYHGDHHIEVAALRTLAAHFEAWFDTGGAFENAELKPLAPTEPTDFHDIDKRPLDGGYYGSFNRETEQNAPVPFIQVEVFGVRTLSQLDGDTEIVVATLRCRYRCGLDASGNAAQAYPQMRARANIAAHAMQHILVSKMALKARELDPTYGFNINHVRSSQMPLAGPGAPNVARDERDVGVVADGVIAVDVLQTRVIGRQEGQPTAPAADPTDLTDWDSRSLTESEGAWGVNKNGRAVRFSVGFGEWIDAAFYDATMTLDAKIDGDVEPNAESPVWTQVEASGGDVSSDGTRVSIDTSGAASEQAVVFISNAGGASDICRVGYFRLSGLIGANPRAKSIGGGFGDGVTCILALAHSDTSPYATFVNGTFAEVGDRYDDVDVVALGEVWVEMYRRDGMQFAYIDHSKLPVAVVSDADQDTTTTKDDIGWGNSSGGSLLEVRDYRVGRF